MEAHLPQDKSAEACVTSTRVAHINILGENSKKEGNQSAGFSSTISHFVLARLELCAILFLTPLTAASLICEKYRAICRIIISFLLSRVVDWQITAWGAGECTREPQDTRRT